MNYHHVDNTLKSVTANQSKRAYPFEFPNWGERFGIGETEFSFLLNNISWSLTNTNDPWNKVRDFIEGFNERRKFVIDSI